MTKEALTPYRSPAIVPPDPPKKPFAAYDVYVKQHQWVRYLLVFGFLFSFVSFLFFWVEGRGLIAVFSAISGMAMALYCERALSRSEALLQTSLKQVADAHARCMWVLKEQEQAQLRLKESNEDEPPLDKIAQLREQRVREASRQVALYKEWRRIGKLKPRETK